jgi:heme-degrading monooxygenase HmoA
MACNYTDNATLLDPQCGDGRPANTVSDAIIVGMPGLLRLTLSRYLERPNIYLLMVEWDRLEDRTQGFRGSLQFQEWRRLLHRFYELYPVVEHYEPVHSA